jgi:CheY-like chemotaxis protein
MMSKESSLQIPLAGAAAASPEPAPATPAESPPGQLGERIPLQILAADDVRTNRELLRQLTSHFGYEAEIVENGAEVLAALDRHPFDLILMDVQMPVMDGLETAREIVRRHPGDGRPKIVALTAGSSEGDREACLAAGMDDCLAKPISWKTFQTCIVRLFPETPSASIPGTPPVQPADSGLLPLVDFAHLETAIPGLSGAQLAAIQRRMHRAVVSDFEKIWPRVLDASSRQDQGDLAEALHGLKGCFSTVGWSRIADRCAEAMRCARAQQFVEWSTLPGELQHLFAASTAEMTRYLAAVASLAPIAPAPPTRGSSQSPAP